MLQNFSTQLSALYLLMNDVTSNIKYPVWINSQWISHTK